MNPRMWIGIVVSIIAVTMPCPVDATPGRWNLATGLCGTVVDLTIQATTGYIFAAVQSPSLQCAGIYRSTNGGVGFQKVGITYPGYSPPRIVDLSPGHDGYVYAATSAGIWRTNSSTMVTWERLINGFPVNAYGVLLGELSMVDWIPNSLEYYATLEPGTTGSGLYRSTDGVNWTLVQPGLDATVVNRGVSCGIPGSSSVFAAARSGGLWVSRDGGTTWSSLFASPTNRPMDVRIDCTGSSGSNPSFQHLFVTNGDPSGTVAVYRSTDFGNTFVPDAQGIPTQTASTVHDDRNPDYGGNAVGTGSPSGGSGDGMYERGSSAPGTPWTKVVAPGLPAGVPITDWVTAKDPLSGNFFYVAAVGGQVYYLR